MSNTPQGILYYEDLNPSGGKCQHRNLFLRASRKVLGVVEDSPGAKGFTIPRASHPACGRGGPSSTRKRLNRNAREPLDFVIQATPTRARPWGHRPLETSPLKSRSQKLNEWKRRQLRRFSEKPPEHKNSFGPLSELDSDCTNAGRLWNQALTSVLHLAAELDVEPVMDIPFPIRCGNLRTAVGKCFPDSADLRLRLSIKTAQKLEEGCCPSCEPLFRERLERWREARFLPIEVDAQHLAAFKKAFKNNVAHGWNRRSKSYAFIPNGNASLRHGRKKGGNWNKEEFSEQCRPDLVFSSGKARVVTMYSSYNNSVLYPLHACMQSYLEHRKWCLIGPPTPERIKELGGKDYLSFDYESATDNIKQPYVEAAVEALIERADPPLSTEEVKCMRVLSQLKIEGSPGVATRGQPMGSLMSFPLLSLCNKTLVDLALADLLQEGQLSFKEWTSHPLLVNGDDLLITEPRPLAAGQEGLASRVFAHGSKIGLQTNKEKTLSDPHLAEINSTLFDRGEVVKKVNVSALYMKQEVTDVLGFAREATVTEEGFRKVVRANTRQLARQTYKGYHNLPFHLQSVCRRDRKIRAALRSVPATSTAAETNFFPIGPLPEGYDLTVEEEVELVHQRVEEVRGAAIEAASSKRKYKKGTKVTPSGRSWRSVKYEKTPSGEEETKPLHLILAWNRKQMRCRAEEASGYWPSEVIVSDAPSTVGRILDELGGFHAARKRKFTQTRARPHYAGTCNDREVLLAQDDPFAKGSEWISLG